MPRQKLRALSVLKHITDPIISPTNYYQSRQKPEGLSAHNEHTLFLKLPGIRHRLSLPSKQYACTQHPPSTFFTCAYSGSVI